MILSDINTPSMDGLQLLREIKQRFPDLPVMGAVINNILCCKNLLAANRPLGSATL